MFLVVVANFMVIQDAFGYLDPGTGSYIFQVLIATLIGVIFTIKMYWKRIQNFFINLFYKKRKL